LLYRLSFNSWWRDWTTRFPNLFQNWDPSEV